MTPSAASPGGSANAGPTSYHPPPSPIGDIGAAQVLSQNIALLIGQLNDILAMGPFTTSKWRPIVLKGLELHVGQQADRLDIAQAEIPP